MTTGVAYLCQSYSAILTFKHIVGDTLSNLKQSHPGSTYSLEYHRGRREENGGFTNAMRVDHTNKVTWNLTKSFVCTVSRSTLDQHIAQKLLDLSLLQHIPGKAPTTIAQCCIDLSPYFKSSKFSKEYFFPITIGTSGQARLHVVVNTEPLGEPIEDYRVDNNTTVGSIEDDDAYDTGLESSYYTSDGASTRCSRSVDPRSPSRSISNNTNNNTTPTQNHNTRHGGFQSLNNVRSSTGNTETAQTATRVEVDLLNDEIEASRRATLKLSEESNHILAENDYLQWELETAAKMLEKERRRNKRMQIRPPTFCEKCNKTCIIL
eukprot:PhM_4_TR18489/c1_g1_i2/m.65384